MSNTFFEELNIPEPNVNLGCGGGTPDRTNFRFIKTDFYELKNLFRPIYNKIVHRKPDVFVCSYVNGANRIAACNKIIQKGGSFINIIHPWANICSTSAMGIGNIIGAFTTISADSVIGSHNIIQDHCNMGHDSIVGDYSHFYVGCIISGKNQIGNNVSVYTGSTIYPKIKVHDNAVVGAGSVVMRHVKPGAIVLGNPAKKVE